MDFVHLVEIVMLAMLVVTLSCLICCELIDMTTSGRRRGRDESPARRDVSDNDRDND